MQKSVEDLVQGILPEVHMENLQIASALGEMHMALSHIRHFSNVGAVWIEICLHFASTIVELQRRGLVVEICPHTDGYRVSWEPTVGVDLTRSES